MTAQQNYLRRATQGATLAHPEPTIEAVVTAYQEHYYPSPVYGLVDPFDIYLWRALDASTKATLALVGGGA